MIRYKNKKTCIYPIGIAKMASFAEGSKCKNFLKPLLVFLNDIKQYFKFSDQRSLIIC